MGPHFFKCGKMTTEDEKKLILRGFNGAALFQVRKDKIVVPEYLATEEASMGPHFFKCGKGLTEEDIKERLNSASMGPHFFKCGKSYYSRFACRIFTRFNGAALFQVRKGKKNGVYIPLDRKLQWGRTFSSAESLC